MPQRPNTMKLAVSMWSYFHAWKDRKIDIPGFIEAAEWAGAEGVELLDVFYRDPANPWERSPLSTTDESVVHGRMLAQSALKDNGMACPIFSISQNFAKPDLAERRAELQKVLFGIEEAIAYGASVVRVFAGDVSEGVEYRQAFDWIIEGLSEASCAADARGLRLALENHGSMAGHSEQVLEIIEAVRARCGNDALGANPDSANFILQNEDSVQAFQRLAPYAYMVHLKDFEQAPEDYQGFAYEGVDGKKYRGTALGEGAIDLEGCIAALKNVGYDGWLSLEYEGEESAFDAVPRSIRYARELIN